MEKWKVLIFPERLVNPPLFNSINEFLSFQLLIEEEKHSTVKKSLSEMNIPSPAKSISLSKQSPPPSPSRKQQQQQQPRKSLEGNITLVPIISLKIFLRFIN